MNTVNLNTPCILFQYKDISLMEVGAGEARAPYFCDREYSPTFCDNVANITP